MNLQSNFELMKNKGGLKFYECMAGKFCNVSNVVNVVMLGRSTSFFLELKLLVVYVIMNVIM